MDWSWEFFADNSDAIQAFAGAVQAFFAVVLVLFTAVQIFVARRQAKTADRTLKAVTDQDRPYVLLTDLEYALRPERDGAEIRPAVVGMLKNFGKTPAIIHEIGFDGPSRGRLPQRPTYMHNYMSHRILPPGGDVPEQIAFSDRRFWKPGRDIKTSEFERPICLAVRVRYTDVLGVRRATAFGYELEGRDRTVVRAGGAAFNYDRQER